MRRRLVWAAVLLVVVGVAVWFVYDAVAGPPRAGIVLAACSLGMAVGLAVLAGVSAALSPAVPLAWAVLAMARLGLPLAAVVVAFQLAAYARAVAASAGSPAAPEPP